MTNRKNNPNAGLFENHTKRILADKKGDKNGKKQRELLIKIQPAFPVLCRLYKHYSIKEIDYYDRNHQVNIGN